MTNRKRFTARFSRRASTRRWGSGLWRYVVLPAVIAVALLLAVRSLWLTQYAVGEDRPECGLVGGDRIVVDRTAYGFRTPFPALFGRHTWGERQPRRGDVVVFECPGGGIGTGRITALPGDTVSRPRRGVLTGGTFACDSVLVGREQIIGRAVVITYSVDPKAPFLKSLRRGRFFKNL